jgi:hypothetical protein
MQNTSGTSGILLSSSDKQGLPEESPKMFKRILLVAVVAVGGLAVAAPEADAQVVVRRIAPVRRVAARAVLPPYPVARRVAVGPVVPYYQPYVYPTYRPVIYTSPAPVIYAPGVTVWGY